MFILLFIPHCQFQFAMVSLLKVINRLSIDVFFHSSEGAVGFALPLKYVNWSFELCTFKLFLNFKWVILLVSIFELLVLQFLHHIQNIKRLNCHLILVLLNLIRLFNLINFQISVLIEQILIKIKWFEFNIGHRRPIRIFNGYKAWFEVGHLGIHWLSSALHFISLWELQLRLVLAGV